MYATKRATTYGYSLWEFQVYGTAVPTNQPPVLAAVPDQTILAGRTLLVTNLASDPNVPPLPLDLQLVQSASRRLHQCEQRCLQLAASHCSIAFDPNCLGGGFR